MTAGYTLIHPSFELPDHRTPLGAIIPDSHNLQRVTGAAHPGLHLREPRERYLALMEDPGYIEDVLKKGAERARAEAAPLMDRLRQSVGLGRFV